jgi:predicted Zn-dependent protease
VDLLQVKAEVLLDRGKPADAIAILRPLVEEFPESARHRVTLVHALITVGDELGAADALRLMQNSLSRSLTVPGPVPMRVEGCRQEASA